jgi:hypothetical protein
MAIAFTGITSDLVSTTLYDVHDQIVDGLYRSLPFLAVSKKLGKIRHGDGSYKLVVPIQTDDQTVGTEITSGWEALNLTVREMTQQAEFNYARYIVPVAMSGKEVASNAGERAIIDLAQARHQAAIQNSMRKINRQIVQGGVLTGMASLNGNTGYGGLSTGFLEANAVESQSNTFGGLTRSTVPGLNNQFLDNAGSSANLIANLQLLETRASTLAPPLSDGGRFHLTLAKMKAYAAYRNLLFTQERFIDAKELDASGVSGIAFSSGVMMPDRDIGFGRADTDDENSFMCLNLDGVWLQVVDGQDFSFTGLNAYSGYDGWIGYIQWQGALAGGHLGSQALMTDAV